MLFPSLQEKPHNRSLNALGKIEAVSGERQSRTQRGGECVDGSWVVCGLPTLGAFVLQVASVHWSLTIFQVNLILCLQKALCITGHLKFHVVPWPLVCPVLVPSGSVLLDPHPSFLRHLLHCCFTPRLG